MVTHANLCFFQMFLWEWFSALASKLTEFPEVVIEEVVFLDGSRRMRPSNTFKNWACRWLNVNQYLDKSSMNVIDKREAFCFRPYS